MTDHPLIYSLPDRVAADRDVQSVVWRDETVEAFKLVDAYRGWIMDGPNDDFLRPIGKNEIIGLLRH